MRELLKPNRCMSTVHPHSHSVSHSRSVSHSHSAIGLLRYHSAKQYKDVFALPSILESHTRTAFPLGDPVEEKTVQTQTMYVNRTPSFSLCFSLSLCFSFSLCHRITSLPFSKTIKDVFTLPSILESHTRTATPLG